MRSDALRNRARIVAAARELVAREGAALTMEDLAGRAGVAVGTLYRHFPTKAALVSAVVEESVGLIADVAVAAVERVRTGASSAAEFDALFRQVADAYDVDRAVKAAAVSLGVTDVPDPLTADPGSAAGRATTAIEMLLVLGRNQGEIRADITVGDLLMLISQLPEGDGARDQRTRYVDIVLAGLRA